MAATAEAQPVPLDLPPAAIAVTGRVEALSSRWDQAAGVIVAYVTGT